MDSQLLVQKMVKNKTSWVSQLCSKGLRPCTAGWPPRYSHPPATRGQCARYRRPGRRKRSRHPKRTPPIPSHRCAVMGRNSSRVLAGTKGKLKAYIKGVENCFQKGHCIKSWPLGQRAKPVMLFLLVKF